jgi:S1-C subfamily serine protease
MSTFHHVDSASAQRPGSSRFGLPRAGLKPVVLALLAAIGVVGLQMAAEAGGNAAAPALQKGKKGGAAKGPGPAVPAPDDKVIDRVKKAVVLVQGKYGHGTGFLVESDLIVTNSHVILYDMIENLTVQFTTDGILDDKLKVKLLYEDKGRDLAILQLEKPQPTRPALPVVKEFNPATMPAVYVVGNPGQVRPGLTLTNTVGLSRCDREIVRIGTEQFYRLDYNANSEDVLIGRGNSGGPAVNAKGEVIGVLTRADFFLDNRPAGTAYCIPAVSVRKALESVGNPAERAAKIDSATARHARDIAFVGMYANASIAYGLIEVRAGVVREVAESGYQLDWGKFQSLNKDVVAMYKDANKRFEEIAKPARIAAMAGKDKEGEQQRQRIAELNKKLTELREITAKTRVTNLEYQRAKVCDKWVQEAFEKFRKESGMSNEVIRSMVTFALEEAGIEVKSK